MFSFCVAFASYVKYICNLTAAVVQTQTLKLSYSKLSIMTLVILGLSHRNKVIPY